MTRPTVSAPAESPPPLDADLEPLADACVIDPEGVLAFVREEAARRDFPQHRHWYPNMSSQRIKNSCLLAQEILEAHLELRRRMGRKAKTGRRNHGQRIYALLASTNDADLMLAIAFLEASLGVLPRAYTEERSRADEPSG